MQYLNTPSTPKSPSLMASQPPLINCSLIKAGESPFIGLACVIQSSFCKKNFILCWFFYCIKKNFIFILLGTNFTVQRRTPSGLPLSSFKFFWVFTVQRRTPSSFTVQRSTSSSFTFFLGFYGTNKNFILHVIAHFFTV